ncbi:MAG: YHS domain-containing (seleno)protein [Leptolyngbyaceae bacterium]|nr:YHS domain-containing (seleno)protein [Leptolyngbyaceae bacterium]
MNISYLASLAIASVLALGLVSCSSSDTVSSIDTESSESQVSSVDPCAGATPCASAAVDPCASASADPCAASAEQVGVFVDGGLAIRGADPVAYFTQGEAVIGSAEFEYEWSGATWRFASAEHRDLFADNPEAYAPQYGGFCAWAVSQGYTAPVEPDAWRIVDGKLYLNYDQKIQERWEQDIDGNIALADDNWPGVLTE